MTPARRAPDPLRSLRARQNAATGDAAEVAWMDKCLRDGALLCWRVGANTSRRWNSDIAGFADCLIFWPDRLCFCQVRATAVKPGIYGGKWSLLRRLPDLPAVEYLLVWLTPAGEWRRWRLYPDGRRAPEGGG